MIVILYTNYEGLHTKEGERFVASSMQSDYYSFQILVDNEQIIGKKYSYSNSIVELINVNKRED